MTTKIKIGDQFVGEGYPTFVIAEAGLNHNGKFAMAKQLVVEAAKGGADAVKFQTILAEKLVSKYHPAYGFFKTIEFSKKQWGELAMLAKKIGIIFLSTPFDQESVNLLDSLGVPAFKIASGDLTHLPLLRHIAKKKKPIILSTGMGTIQEIREAVQTITKTGNKQLAILHCISQYPARSEQMNLQMIGMIKKMFHVPTGFSDQTIGIWASLAAVARGANLIERHFTLSHKLPGPDHALSVDPQELAQLIKGIREIEKMAGVGWPRVRPDASEMRGARRNIVAAKYIAKGTKITPKMLKIVRAGNKGLPPKEFEKIIGKVAKKDIQAEQALTKKDI